MRPISIQTNATVREREVLAAALSQLRAALASDGEPPVVDLTDIEPNATAGPALVVTSLMADLETADSWSIQRAQIVARYEAMAASDDRLIFVMTLFRHVDPGLPNAAQLRLAIRRLNFLAVELSHQFGVFIIDLDRSLADIGGLRLHGDYRLSSPNALAAASRAIALDLLNVGLDDFAPLAAQTQARRAIEREPVLTGDDAPHAHALAAHVSRPVRAGGRVQHANFSGTNDDVGRTALLLKQVFTGKMALSQSLSLLTHVMRERGAKRSLELLRAAILRTPVLAKLRGS